MGEAMSKLPLSPAARAVLDAYKQASDGHYIDGEWIQDHAGQIAAALRAVATEVVLDKYQYADRDAQLRRNILAIAAELEALP